jgi:hemerythrin-like domain-containing protein
MLRSKNLIPLSHQHQHALSLCVRMDRAAEGELTAFQREMVSMWETEICAHFEAEEQVLFPVAAQFPSLKAMVEELLRDHDSLRGYFDQARTKTLKAGAAREFTALLSAHIRMEERQLFEECQRLMDEAELDRLGAEMARRLSESPGQSCAMKGPKQS